MAVHCANCGEELLGAVNCCWSCGHAFEAHSGPSDLPPVRRAPPARPAAVVIDAEDGESGGSAAEGGAAEHGKILRRGSPFADRGTSETVAAGKKPDMADSPPTPRTPPRGFGGSATAASLTIPIGGIALLLAFAFPSGGIVVAAFGIAIGTWGLYSRHRGVALAGLMLCCLSLALAGFNSAVQVYVYFNNVAPWESNDLPMQ